MRTISWPLSTASRKARESDALLAFAPDLPRRPGMLRRFRREVVERLVDPSGPVRRLLSGAQVTAARVEGRLAVVDARSSTASLRFVVAAREGGLRVVRIE